MQLKICFALLCGLAANGASVAQQQKISALGTQLGMEIRDKVGGDIDALIQESGLRQSRCPSASALRDNVTVQSWEIQSAGAVLDVFLSAAVDYKTSAPQFDLKLHWASTRDDGALAPVAPRLANLVQRILDQYHFPSEYLFDNLGVHVRKNSKYWSKVSSGSIDNAWEANGHHGMRGERYVGIARTGPFIGQNSWRQER